MAHREDSYSGRRPLHKWLINISKDVRLLWSGRKRRKQDVGYYMEYYLILHGTLQNYPTRTALLRVMLDRSVAVARSDRLRCFLKKYEI